MLQWKPVGRLRNDQNVKIVCRLSGLYKLRRHVLSKKNQFTQISIEMIDNDDDADDFLVAEQSEKNE